MPNLHPVRDQLIAHVRQFLEEGCEAHRLLLEAERASEDLGQATDLINRLKEAPKRSDWPYSEPDDLLAIHQECHPKRPIGLIADVPDASARVETAFLTSVSGSILGKPLEFNPTLKDLERVLSSVGEWPIVGYVGEAADAEIINHIGRPMTYWNRVYREKIRFVMPDDDLNYRVLGMVLLEMHGKELKTEHVRKVWMDHLPLNVTFGPEHATLGLLAIQRIYGDSPVLPAIHQLLVGGDHRGNAHCGAQIRADAYGYACPGDPTLASDLAFQDASLTHRGTGLYATMWTAAAIAIAQTAPRNPLDIFRLANKYVPQRSRFHQAVEVGLALVESSDNWRDGYDRIHSRMGRGDCGSHCGVFEETATLINTLRWATSCNDGLCIQMMQGNDTDSYGATAGSILGAYFGPGSLDLEKWIAPFNDDFRTALAWFWERSLKKVTTRMSDLPRRLREDDRFDFTDQ